MDELKLAITELIPAGSEMHNLLSHRSPEQMADAGARMRGSLSAVKDLVTGGELF